MNFVVKKNMFKTKKFEKGNFKRGDKFMYWINLWGFGIIVTNTVKGLKYDVVF